MSTASPPLTSSLAPPLASSGTIMISTVSVATTPSDSSPPPPPHSSVDEEKKIPPFSMSEPSSSSASSTTSSSSASSTTSSSSASSTTPTKSILKGRTKRETFRFDIKEQIKRDIAKIVGIPCVNDWDIYDSISEKGLYLIHYQPDGDMKKYGHIRGIIVDIYRKVIVCCSYSFTPAITVDPNGTPFKVTTIGTTTTTTTITTTTTTIHDDGKEEKEGVGKEEKEGVGKEEKEGVGKEEKEGVGKEVKGEKGEKGEKGVTGEGSGDLTVTDSNTKKEYKWKSGRYQIKVGLEGVIIRVFMHDGVVYHSSHKKIDCSNSHWGDSDNFKSMYRRLGGPEDEKLFNLELKNSDYCYIFMVVDKSLIIGSRQQVGSGYCVYLSTNLCGTGGTGKIEKTGTETKKELGLVKTFPSGPISGPLLIDPEFMTLEQALNHLKHGYHSPLSQNPSDPRLFLGEFVVIYGYDDNGKLNSCLRIQSRSYTWRVTMRDENSSIPNRFQTLLNAANYPVKTEEDVKIWKASIPIFPKFKIEELSKLAKTNSLVYLPDKQLDSKTELELLKTQEDRAHLVWIAFLVSVPVDQQHLMVGLLEEVATKKVTFLEYIYNLYLKEVKAMPLKNGIKIKLDDGKEAKYPKRFPQIISLARKHTAADIKAKLNVIDGKELTFEEYMKVSLKKIIDKERGDSLRRLIEFMNNPRKTLEKINAIVKKRTGHGVF